MCVCGCVGGWVGGGGEAVTQVEEHYGKGEKTNCVSRRVGGGGGGGGREGSDREVVEVERRKQ